MKRKVFNDSFGGVEIIDCKNDSVSMALQFNKAHLSQIGLPALIFWAKSKIITFYPKFSFTGTFHQISI